MKLCELLYDDEYETALPVSKDMEIDNLTRNPEKIGNNTLFFLLKRIKNDSDNIIIHIKERAPKLIVCQKDSEVEVKDSCVVYVENVRKTMAFVYSRFYKIDYKRTKFIAVTGTNGKTTTATIIKHILEYNGEKVGFIGTGKIEIGKERITEEFYSMTTPDPEVLYPAVSEMQKEKCNYIIMEASSHALYFDKLAPIPFEIGIFTNLAHEHLDFHNTEESYFNSKLKLFAQCKIGIFNCDDKYSRKASNEVECESISTGILWPADAMAREIVQKGISGSEYIYKEKSLIFKAKILLPGAYNIYNSLLAIKTAIRLGIKPCCVKEALLSLTAIDGRFEATVDKIIVIRDYAHTPEALENLLKTVKSLKKSKQNVITVFGCGGERDKTKRPVMAEIAEKNSDFVIVTNDNPRGENENEIISDILKGFKDTAKRTVISDRKRAIEYAIMNTVQNDIVVIAGKGGESYIIDKAGYHHFSEKEIIEKALSRRNEEEAKYANKARNSDNN